MNEYEPWKEQGITELEFWKKRYLEERKLFYALAQVIEPHAEMGNWFIPRVKLELHPMVKELKEFLSEVEQ